MSRLRLGFIGAAVVAAGWLAGCPAPDDAGLQVVKVPPAAYLPWDGGRPEAAARDAGREAAAPAIVCIDAPDEAPPEEHAAEGYEECPATYQGHGFDPEATERHRGDGQTVCCYRGGHGHKPPRRVIRLDDPE